MYQTLPNEFFRKLSASEEEKFRQWARDNWSPTRPENFAVFHPSVREEWERLDAQREADNA